MMLAKPEFVTVYEVLLSDEDMENNIGELTIDPVSYTHLDVYKRQYCISAVSGFPVLALRTFSLKSSGITNAR